MKSMFLFLLLLSSTHTGFSQITWDEEYELTTSLIGQNRPRVTIDGNGNPLVIWGFWADLMFSRWDGSAFTEPIKLNPTGVEIAAADFMGPEIASHGDTVYIVYKQKPEDLPTSHIWCMRSLDGGITFEEPVAVENVGNDKSRFPVVATDDDGHPIIAFMRFNSQFLDARWVVTRSFDHGLTFQPDVLASGWSGPDSEVCDCCTGSIQASGDIVTVTYRDNNDNLRDSWAGISYDGGLTFTSGVNVDQNGWEIAACPASGPDGVIVGDSLYTIFMNAEVGIATVYHNATFIPGATNPPSIPVPFHGPNSLQNIPRIASHGDAVALIWRQSANLGRTDLMLLFAENITNGLPSIPDTAAYLRVATADVALSENKIYIPWVNPLDWVIRVRTGHYGTSVSTDQPNHTASFFISPNPANEEWKISGVEAKGEISIKVLDLNGRTVYDHNQQQVETQATLSIPCQSLSSGVYLIYLSTREGNFVGKAIQY